MELEIDGILAELGNSVPAITRKSIDINNPSSRFVDFTNSFQLPVTGQNRKIFESPELVGSNNRSFDKLYDVVLRDLSILFQGHGFLTGVTKDNYLFQVVAKSKDLFNNLNVKLNTVNWDDKDTVLTQTSIDAQDEYDIDNCWIWGKMCCHKQPIIANTDQTTGDDRTKYSRPQFNVNSLLKRAIEAQGYTFTEPSERLAISSNHKQFFFADYQKTFNATYNPAGTLQLTGFDTYDFKEAGVTVTNTTVKGTSKHNYRVRGNFTSTGNIYIQIYSIDQSGTKPIYNTIQLPASGFLDYSSSEIDDGPTGMTTTFSLVGTGTVIFEDVLIYKIVDERNEDLSTNPFLNHYIKAYDNLPDDLTYIDLYKLICVLFDKYPIVDAKNKTFSFGSLANLNKLNAVNWSEKFVEKSEQVSSNYSGLFQKNILRYTNDITVPYNHAEGSFNTDNESLEKEGDYIALQFSSTIDVIVNSNTIAQVEIYEETGRIVDREIRKRVYKIVGSTLTFDGLHWEELASTYYSDLFRSLNRVRALDVSMNLKKLDVIKWSEKQLVYIDYFESTFIVLEISNFISGRLTKIKLLNYGRP